MTQTPDTNHSGQLVAPCGGDRDPAILVGWIAIAFIASLLVVGFCT